MRIIILFLFLSLVSQSVQAGGTGSGAAGLVPCGNGSSSSDRCTLCHLVIGFQGLINYGFNILVYVALAMLLVGGVIYVVSAGDQGMIGMAKGIIKNTLMGFAFVLGAWLIINYTLVVLGAKSNLGIEKATGGWNSFQCSTSR